ncbi:Uncharacterised protein [Vibrio cholerae]|uniref:Uncharacterized protein n=1 Tax=Vibrio cholerae TaxID=666 RepID=A0A655TJH3_VIBCL|nr:Uncharacterised protein [Vibrio cholerae]CSB36653.1 Uncharacterised protein [Vibrio cholerae]CSB57300.1 Uncharacterised protein [Vibrio cholerae]CSC65344.1 Uncharacterised protein [Vibrio cholerae]CSC76452.1 Uncharacterised protein [Vibrio cholerae]
MAIGSIQCVFCWRINSAMMATAIISAGKNQRCTSPPSNSELSGCCSKNPQ